MFLVSDNAAYERRLYLTPECIALIRDALDILHPDGADDERKRQRILSMIAEHEHRDRLANGANR